jgi:two-component system chemotaxis response regulator CheB
MADNIKVMIVDDSALVRQVVSQALTSAPGIEVIGTASDPLFALQKMKAQWPDVLVIDIEMPRMDGISFLKKIMAERPRRSSAPRSLKGRPATFDAGRPPVCRSSTSPRPPQGFLEDLRTTSQAAVPPAPTCAPSAPTHPMINAPCRPT